MMPWEELEEALARHAKVAEAAVVVPADAQGIVCFVVLVSGTHRSEEVKQELLEYLAGVTSDEASVLARSGTLRWVDALPKTRTGRILRRLLHELAAEA